MEKPGSGRWVVAVSLALGVGGSGAARAEEGTPASGERAVAVEVSIDLLRSENLVARQVARDMRAQLEKSFLVTVAPGRTGAFRVMIDSAPVSGVDIPLEGIVAVFTLECSGQALYGGHRVAVCSYNRAEQCAAALAEEVPGLVREASGFLAKSSWCGAQRE